MTPIRPILPASRSASSHGRCSSHATRLWICSTSTRPNQASWSAYWRRASSADGLQIFVSTTASSRRPSSARPSECSAAPYIGDESKQRLPASSAAPTTSRASGSSPLNVFHVPSPTTGPRRRSSISRASSRASDTGRVGGPEEGGILVRPAAHVRRAAARAHASSQPSSVARPRPRSTSPRQSSSTGLRVMRDAAVALARVGVGRADGEHRPSAERDRDVGGVGERERAVPEPRPRADDARADGADDRVVPLLLRPRERRGRR